MSVYKNWRSVIACNIQYAAPGSDFAVMAPKSVLTHTVTPTANIYTRCTTAAPNPGQFTPVGIGAIGQASTFIGLLFLTFVAARSTSSKYWDFYRVMALYLVGTIGVPLSIMLAYLFGVHDPGFTRIFGYGIIAHNFSEIFVLGSFWAGTVSPLWHNAGFLIAMTYLVATLIFISVLQELPVLLLILMTLGAGLDFSMLITWSYIGFGSCCCGRSDGRYRYFGWAIAAAALHLGIVEVLFFSILESKLNLFVTNTFVPLLPNFLLYMYFAELDTKTSHWGRMFGPYLAYIGVGTTGGAEDANEMAIMSTSSPSDAADAGDAKESQQDAAEEDGPLPRTVTLLRRGGILYSGDPQFPNPWTAFYAIIGVGFGASLTNSLVFLFLPCYGNLKC